MSKTLVVIKKQLCEQLLQPDISIGEKNLLSIRSTTFTPSPTGMIIKVKQTAEGILRRRKRKCKKMKEIIYLY